MRDSGMQRDFGHELEWDSLSGRERVDRLRRLPRAQAEELFLSRPSDDQVKLFECLSLDERRSWLRVMAPDDAADLLQRAPPSTRSELLSLLDDHSQQEVRGLLAYAEDEAGGLMSPRYARLRPHMTADEAITYLRRQARERLETVYYVYVLDDAERLLGVVSFRELFAAEPSRVVQDVMRTDLVTLREHEDQEVVARVFRRHGLLALPVVDAGRQLKGIVTVDDVVDVVDEEATEDIQKSGAVQALGEPYLRIGFWQMVGKRAGWLAALFLGEMLTATAMARYETEIARAVVLAVFVPLIISSGGNSGSQASTLVIRAMALGELTLRDWWRVVRREIVAGLALGGVLGGVGFLRIVVWHAAGSMYGEHYLRLATTVALSLVGVVAFGTLAGSGLPFLLRLARIDPASASGPFVATLVDVTGLVIYFTTATLVLEGTLL
jgi:magnesium transporter